MNDTETLTANDNDKVNAKNTKNPQKLNNKEIDNSIFSHNLF